MRNRHPVLLHYFITNRCNARCAFCTIWKEQPKADAVPGDMERNLRQARAAGCRFADFTGGEPLMNPHLPAFLETARKFGYITSVTTNCLLFKEQAPGLRGLIDLLHFSLDADTAEVNNELRGAESYHHVLDSIPAALENDLYPDLLFTYTDRNIGAFEGVYGLARKYRLIVILDPVFALEGADTVSAAAHAKARAFARRPGVYLNTAHLALRAMGGNSPERNFCKAALSTVVVLPDNTLALPCYHHRNDTVPIGGDLGKALGSSQRAEAIEREGRYEFCGHCHINCYFDPSYLYMRNRLFMRSMAAKLKYAFYKHLVYRRPVPGVRWPIHAIRSSDDKESQ
jgi:MoaA/NifB/PqqE/SkfB family radical SAM enzyme